MSSKSYRIIKEIRPPVLSVAGQTTTIQRVLICSGGKRYINDAVRLAGESARGVGATVTLFHVMPEPPAMYGRSRQMAEETSWLLRSRTELAINLREEKHTIEASGVRAQ